MRFKESPTNLFYTTKNFICKTKNPVTTRKNMISEEMPNAYGTRFDESTHFQDEFKDPSMAKHAIQVLQFKMERHKKTIREALIQKRLEEMK
jgi:hypothetical protein